MSFFSIPDGSGPLADVFTDLTFEAVAYYVVSWLYWIFHSTWFTWAIYIGFFYLTIRIIMNLISAFNSKQDEPVD